MKFGGGGEGEFGFEGGGVAAQAGHVGGGDGALRVLDRALGIGEGRRWRSRLASRKSPMRALALVPRLGNPPG